MTAIFPMFLTSILYVALIGLSFYALFLFIKLARRGIKALDIYINEKNGQGNLNRHHKVDGRDNEVGSVEE